LRTLSEPEFRHERKFLLPAPRAALLRARLSAVMRPDPHAGPAGSYHIRSLYFDDLHDSCLTEGISGTDPREKYRIRFYDGKQDVIHLERKRKERGLTSKENCLLTVEQAEILASGRYLPDAEDSPAVLRALCLEMRGRGMRPVITVDYDRTPFILPEGNVRITFDTNLASSPPPRDLFSEDLPKRAVFPTGTVLLEVKYDAFLPDLLTALLHTEDLRQTAFSKYVLCRKYALTR